MCIYFTHCFLKPSTFHMDGPLSARPKYQLSFFHSWKLQKWHDFSHSSRTNVTINFRQLSLFSTLLRCQETTIRLRGPGQEGLTQESSFRKILPLIPGQGCRNRVARGHTASICRLRWRFLM